MNTVALVGRLTKDPHARDTTTGRQAAVLRLAVPRGTSGSDDAVFVTVVCFDRLAAATLDHLGRGRRVAVTGRLDQRTWTDDAGNRRERHQVVAERIDFLDAPAHAGAGPGAGEGGADAAPDAA